jgi:2-polyprenyl-6-methoxyphenol hydroxylase-like FAD-dependent oxidoreductase
MELRRGGRVTLGQGLREIATMPDKPVLVVGAGPTGLVLAIELARRGVPFHLVDRHPEPLRWDRATTLKARSLEVFGGIGLADTFVRRGRIVRGVNLFLGEAKVASYRFDGLDSPFPFMLSIPEDETERILAGKLEQLGAQVERGVEFAGLEQGERSGRARLRSLYDGERTLEASWVVGTDGFHSAVREAIGDEFDGHDEPTPWGVVDAHLAGWGHPGNLAAVQLQPPMLFPMPLPRGRWRVFFRPDPQEDDFLATVGARLRAISPGAALQDPDEPQLFHTHSRIARRYRFGRVLLAGDAAHACSPFEGHGMNTGIQDAYNLGWKLGLVVSGAAPKTLLDSYEAERRPVAQAIARSGDDAEARVTQQDPATSAALITLLATPQGRQLAAVAGAEIAFGYDKSPIVDEVVPAPPSAAWGTQVGYRIGDAAPLEGRNRACRLHELIAVPGHTLLLMLGEASPAAVDEGLALATATAQRYRPHLQAYVVTRNARIGGDASDALLCDPTGALHERLGADRPCLCLLRPDGHLAFRGEPPYLEALYAHLRRIFLKLSTRSRGGSSAVPAHT